MAGHSVRRSASGLGLSLGLALGLAWGAAAQAQPPPRALTAQLADLVAASDGDIKTMAPYTEIKTDLRRLVSEKVGARSPATKPLDAPGRPGEMRIDLRLATDSDGEIYVLTKTDGMVRRIVSIE